MPYQREFDDPGIGDLGTPGDPKKLKLEGDGAASNPGKTREGGGGGRDGGRGGGGGVDEDEEVRCGYGLDVVEVVEVGKVVEGGDGVEEDEVMSGCGLV